MNSLKEPESNQIQIQSKQKVIIFLHIPKAGGTTLNGVINQQYRRKQIYRFNGINSRDKIGKLSQSRRAQLKLIRGHFAFGLHKYLSCESTYFTMLRDPVKREISNYHYLRRSSGLKGHAVVKQQSLEEYILSTKGNLQTRLLFGLSDVKPKNDRERVDVAKQNLDRYFSVTGIVERFDESLILIQEAFGWRTPIYVKQNVTKPRQQEDTLLSPETLALIQEHNAMDIELYDYVVQKFNQEVAELGTRLEALLKAQQRKNRLYQPLGRTYSLSRHLVLKHLLKQY